PARSVAPIDLTGYWVSVITEDWRWRMTTPARGDYASVPLTNEARRAADTWDLARDEASGNACKPFGVGNIMRMPGRHDVEARVRRGHADASPAFRLFDRLRAVPGRVEGRRETSGGR